MSDTGKRTAQETKVPAHAEYVRKLAETLGLTES
jgi:hypothetical protein